MKERGAAELRNPKLDLNQTLNSVVGRGVAQKVVRWPAGRQTRVRFQFWNLSGDTSKLSVSGEDCRVGLGCSVAQLVVRWPDVWQARLRISVRFFPLSSKQ